LAVRGLSAARAVPEATEEWAVPGIVVEMVAEMAAGMVLPAPVVAVASDLELEVVVVSHRGLAVGV
jgi:hypothetical protein